jgi:hypothetical protein
MFGTFTHSSLPFVKSCFISWLLGVCFLARTDAAVPLSESFDYTNGPLTTASGGLWSAHSGSSLNPVDVSDGRVNLTFAET